MFSCGRGPSNMERSAGNAFGILTNQEIIKFVQARAWKLASCSSPPVTTPAFFYASQPLKEKDTIIASFAFVFSCLTVRSCKLITF